MLYLLLLLYTIYIYMGNISVLVDIFHYRALFCPLLAIIYRVLHTVKYIFCVLFSRLLFFLFCRYYSVVLV